MTLPAIGITMGDPAGVGPEVVLKALKHLDVYAFCRPLVIGDRARLAAVGRIVGVSVEDDDLPFECIDLGLVPADLPFGKVSAAAGEAAYRYIERAVKMALDRRIDAICTAPINKEALNAAGHKFPGHTELLAELTGTKEVSLTLLAPKLRVIHVTAHIGLLDAIARIDAPLIERTIARGRELLVRSGMREPRIGVCGINPHAGEGGLFGRGEEETKIAPAIAATRARGWKVDGPLPADSLFYLAARGDYDLVVAMYHDQGHGPVKALGLEHGVNVTAGLPIVRTSVDHGTAFDIAGTGRADERSMIEALKQAAALAPPPRAG
ncbi:MAG TPA: 4-hydroxythreonine-4-phosphate dehydrogenase PdxA [Burkholderiales bacterium]|jgi:4-hydroxythreonine-4-phosphate dehydrogenase|nr:4-hydroxythreonine-4-phosphate dehydrogenase PdxA [Burkholderiales bacterium]